MEEIKRVITVDTKNSDKSIRDLKNEIKGLQKELEQTAVGSDEFNSALKRLTQTQRSYNEIQQQVRSMSKTNEQNMVKMASFARNLGKAYSSLNAAIGLFADGNEDVQKTMLKVQRSIQLIQGLDGIVGIIRDLPNVARGFRDWLSSLSPIERSVDRIARGINGIDPKKLNGINGPNGTGGAGGGAAAAAGAGGGGTRINIEAENKAIERQTQILAANGKALEDAGGQYLKLDRMLQQYDDTLEEVALHLQDEIELKEIEVEKTKEQVGEKDDLYKKQQAELDGLIKKRTQLTESLNQQEAAIKDEMKTIELSTTTRREAINIIQQQRDSIQNLYEELVKGGQGDSTRAKAYKRELDLLNEQEKSLQLSTRAAKGLGNTLKQAFNFIWINAWVIAIVAAGAALIKYLGNLKKATIELRKFNKAVAESTNQISAKQIVVLKELANGYQKVGDSAEEKQKFIEKYAEKIKETGVAINDVETAEDAFINNTDKYVNAMIARAKAQAIEQQAVKLYEEAMNDIIALEDKYSKKKNKDAGTTDRQAYIDLLVSGGYSLEQAEQAWLEANKNSEQKILDEIEERKRRLENALKRIFGDIPEPNIYDWLSGGSAEAKATADPVPKELEDTIKKDLEALIQYYKEAEQVLSDEMVNAKQAIMDKYAERIALAEKYGRDTVQLELAREKELADLEKQFAEQEANEEYQRIQTHIEQIRRMYDTANLREPTEQRYQTAYQQPPITRALGLIGLATGTDWINVYQSKEDVENQLKAQIEYNDQFYLLTKQRIEQENELLNQQLEIEGLSADQRMEIQRTLTENMIALSDAQLQNEQANLQAYLDAQEKRRQALNGILDVTSTLTGAIAQMARMEAENAEEGSKKQKAATVAYKAFAITQAIVDTYKGANEAYTAMASIPYVGPVLGAIAAGAAIASGIANVMAIKREDISGSTNVSSQASVTAPSALNTPPIEYTRNLIGDKELDEMNAPIRCYVLEQDVTNVQNKVKVTEQNASF